MKLKNLRKELGCTVLKLFEIPVYAISRKNLIDRYRSFCAKLKNEHPSCSEEHMTSLVALMTYPYRLWDYNHIVGYIRISTNGRDILFDIFLPEPHKDRYHWRSEHKVFLYDISANGTHFYVSSKMCNDDIQVRAAETLQAIIETHIPKRYFVDTEAFYHLNPNLDYLGIISDQCGRGDGHGVQDREASLNICHK